MSDKQTVLDAVSRLPDSATWAEITDAVVRAIAGGGRAADVAWFHGSQLRPEQVAEYLNPPAEVPLADVVAELASRPFVQGQA